MNINDLINTLREWAETQGPKTTLGGLLDDAADTIEALDERVAIMEEGNNNYADEPGNMAAV